MLCLFFWQQVSKDKFHCWQDFVENAIVDSMSQVECVKAASRGREITRSRKQTR